ncbi:MAG TPA: ABC transporter permease [Chitinophagales bacterium]|nr:ABC transporter permease [Chitinophagales bacterium]
MFGYIAKRILYFIPTFFIIALFTFLLSAIAPGDPVELKLSAGMQGSEGNGRMSDKLAGEDAYRQLNEKLGRNLPLFYFTVTSKSYPDTLYKILRQNERENLARLVDEYNDWPQIQTYYLSVKRLEYMAIAMPVDLTDSTAFEQIKTVRESCNDLYRNYKDGVITIDFQKIAKAVSTNISIQDSTGTAQTYYPLARLKPYADSAQLAYTTMKEQQQAMLKYIPAVHWYGLHNQFHRWLFGDVPWFGPNNDPTKVSKGFFRGDFGESYLDSRPVSAILGDAMKWTLLINIIAFIIIYTISIPSGVSIAVRKGTFYDRSMTALLFVLYSIPSFWVGTMLIIFFTSDYYGNWMNLFPPYGLGKIGPEFTTWVKVSDRAYHLALPIFCIVYGSFAFISRQVRGGMLSVLRQDYIRTAFAKGLTPGKVFWKHAFRNSLIPIITLFSSFLPAMISGSVIIEYLFTIPGMGRVSYESVIARNFPVLFTILMFSAILTMAGTLLSDILYVVTDPRVSFTKKEG